MKRKLTFLLIFVVLSIYKGYSITIDNSTNNSINETILIDSIKTENKKSINDLTVFSVENLYNYLIDKGINDPSYIIPQFMIETGNFKSNLFVNANNVCGMRLSKKRKNTAIGKTKSGYAKYENWMKGVDDFLLWLKYNSINVSNGNYIYSLKRVNYNKNPRYVGDILKSRKIFMRKYKYLLTQQQLTN